MRRIFEAVYQVFFDKKWGILIKMESESLIFTGLEIPRDYLLYREVRSMKKILMRFIYWILMEEAKITVNTT